MFLIKMDLCGEPKLERKSCLMIDCRVDETRMQVTKSVGSDVRILLALTPGKDHYETKATLALFPSPRLRRPYPTPWESTTGR